MTISRLLPSFDLILRLGHYSTGVKDRNSLESTVTLRRHWKVYVGNRLIEVLVFIESNHSKERTLDIIVESRLLKGPSTRQSRSSDRMRRLSVAETSQGIFFGLTPRFGMETGELAAASPDVLDMNCEAQRRGTTCHLVAQQPLR